ncbi:DNA (cytosine-5-)-methyltransferase [Arcobacter sp.]|uniref:DNA (cytosine-5-)-methyltransferase n=1 Tax=unclassified Arcobacter TaxID=2593671 RepID=UPI003B006945
MSINEKPNLPLRVATAFSGGLAAVEFALKYENTKHEIIFACEWDKYARQQYLKFHGKPKTFYNDIKELCAKKYLFFIDLFVWGSPCQDLSLSGNREGLTGSKSSHFFHGARVQEEMKPKVFIFENVVGLLSSNGGADYKLVCDTFRKQGYYIHLSRMNAKDYGDPQNRDRIFIIGFLDVNAYHRYKTPEKIPLELRLKDVLQKWVPEKYFLSQKMIDGFIAHKERHQERGNGFGFNPTSGDKVAACLNTVSGNRSTDDYIKVGYINQNTQASSVVSVDGVSNTLTSGTHGYAQGYFINSNTKSGYETAKDYDCINLSRPTSTIRRGRVGKGYAQTLECSGNIGVIYNFMIRRLTPFETFRLQGLKDEDIILIVSDTQAYKISGNAINVTVMRHILRALYQKQEVVSPTSLFDFI